MAEGNPLEVYIPAYDYQNQAQSPFHPGCDLPPRHRPLVHQALCAMAEQGMSRWHAHWPGPTRLARSLAALRPASQFGNGGNGWGQAADRQSPQRPFLQARLNQPQRCQAEQTWWQVAADGVTLKQIRPDLLWYDDDGRAWLIDYKTAEPQAGEPVEAFIQAQKHLPPDATGLRPSPKGQRYQQFAGGVVFCGAGALV